MSYRAAPGSLSGTGLARGAPGASSPPGRRREGGSGPATRKIPRVAGPHAPVTRCELALAVPAGSRRARSQHEFLTRLGEDPDLAQLRADRARNITEVGRIMARFASWTDRTTRPTRARICSMAGISVSTFKSARRWLEGKGFLGLVRQGWTAMLRAAVLADPDEPNEAAIWILCVPRRKPRETPPVTTDQVTRPLSLSRRESGLTPAPARENPRVTPLRTGPGERLTDEHAAAIARPFLAAGWTPADLRHALEHGPDRRHTFRLSDVGSPAHWLAWRLSRWTTEPDVTWQAFRELGRWPRLPRPVPVMSPSQRAWQDVTPVGQVYLERNRAKAAAARAPGITAEARAIFDRIRNRSRP